MATCQALRRLGHRSGGQTFTAPSATGRKNPATANGGFTGTKPMTTFTNEHGRTPQIGDE